MSYSVDELSDKDWQRDGKFSLLKFLKYLSFLALYLALVGRRRAPAAAASVPVPSRPPAEPPRRRASR